MIHRIPPGTRDVLPAEMRELRRLQGALAAVFERFGYGEVATPTIEYDEVLARGDERGAPVAYRFFDADGELLAMRTDMTVPIARLVATRLAGDEPPFRLSYFANAYRAVRPQRGQMREFAQAGVELVGADAPEGTAEVIEVLSAALDAVGLTRAVIGLGDADLYRQLLGELDVSEDLRERILALLAAHDLVGLEREVDALGLRSSERETLLRLPNLRGGAEVLARINLDLGLLRDLGYYTGAILEVYDPALGHVLGGGGRYDELMGRFGRPLPAAGFALYLERVHIAQAEEERLAEASREHGAGSVQP